MSTTLPHDLPLGWLEFHKRTDEQHAEHNRIVAQMPSFGLATDDVPPVGTKIMLTDSWKHPDVIAKLGYEFPGWHQFTGSCVGVGGANAVQTTNFLDVLQRNEAEKLILFFWAYNYGMSRQRAGMRGEGEGSMGATFAESLKLDGGIDWLKDLNLPDYRNGDQLEIGASAERIWSDGSEASQAIREAAKPHTCTVAPLNSGAAVRTSIMNSYPVTRAFGTFVNPGSASVRNGVLMARRYDGRGGHQESWQGYWHHPDLGELILEMNQWGKKVYGIDPGGAPDGSVWLPMEAIDEQCQSRYSEIFAWSNYAGYPAQPNFYDWMKRSFFS